MSRWTRFKEWVEATKFSPEHHRVFMAELWLRRVWRNVCHAAKRWWHEDSLLKQRESELTGEREKVFRLEEEVILLDSELRAARPYIRRLEELLGLESDEKRRWTPDEWMAAQLDHHKRKGEKHVLRTRRGRALQRPG